MAAERHTPVGLERGFRGALRVQLRVIYALLMRELLTRYGRNNLGFLWLFLEPMMFTIAITLIWTATRSIHGSDIPITEFALTGYSAMLLWRNLPGRCMSAVQSNIHLLHHRQVTVIDVYYSRILLEEGAVTTSFVVLGVLFWVYGWLVPPEDALQVLAGWLLLAWFGIGLALTLAALADRYEIVEKLWSPLSYMLFPFSGAAFIADTLPEKAREIVLYLPMLHAVEFIRDGFFGSHFTAHYSLSYLCAWNLGLSLFGLSQVRLIGGSEQES
ncbi:Polysialic acid transport protein KpsM [Sphingomonas sp. S2M10]|jgi:ABC-2 type transport system permease protein/capsular polysaccharide transport system permease protein|uniref:ABC transporter permease n=1 Tax=Sphingomonas sp. S2M10 TaxID=2705010 RepID=UPI00145702BA|nr:ABC transporter permease [Sphingomonas sp. S2M10]NLS29235.1 Polysialic acid transport protein KpsM [Sphingomonas sp. S2M10]